MEREFNVTTPDGVMPCFATWPEGDGPHPVIVLYMDAPGIREELYNFARRIAAQGYYAVLPDLYYRLGTHRFNLANRTEKMTEMIFAAWHSLSNADVVNDTAALLDALGDDAAASDGPYGLCGLLHERRFRDRRGRLLCPDRFAANVSLYGVWIVTDKPTIHPHLLAPQIEGRDVLRLCRA